MAPERSTAGGTSDGLGAELVELGPINTSLHEIDEHVALDKFERVPALYRALVERRLGG